MPNLRCDHLKNGYKKGRRFNDLFFGTNESENHTLGFLTIAIRGL